MHRLSLMLLALAGCLAAQDLRANTCNTPSTPMEWATDACLLRANTQDVSAPAVKECLSHVSSLTQICEFSASYKEEYCKVLIKQGKTKQSLSACVADPNVAGPTVRHGQA